MTIRYQINPEDKFILVLPAGFESPHSKRAIETLKNFFATHFNKIELETRYIGISDFSQGILEFLHIILEHTNSGYHVYVNPSGGMRVLSLIAFSAGLIARKFAPKNIKLTEMEIEGRTEYLEIFFPPLALPELTRTQIEIIRLLLCNKRMNVEEIANEIDRSKSTIYRNIEELEKIGLISLLRKDKKTIIIPTKATKLLIEILRDIKKY